LTVLANLHTSTAPNSDRLDGAHVIWLTRHEGMGLWMSKLLTLFGEKEARILVLGLDNAGKTTILCKPSTAGTRVVCKYVKNFD